MKIWDIGGQSNGLGLGEYSGTFPGNPLVSAYYINGVLTPFGPANVGFATPTHGCELGLAAALTAQFGAIAINKSASSGASLQSLMTTFWPAHQAGINAIKGLGTEYHHTLIQGENEAGNNASSPALVASYTSDLTNWASMIRTQFGGSVQLHILRLCANLIGYPGLASIRTAQTNFAASDGNTFLYDMDDQSPLYDGTHYLSYQYREMGRRCAITAGATVPVWEKRLLVGANANDVAICNALEPPSAGPTSGSGFKIVIPSNWQALIAGGTDVPGCTYARLASDGSLTVSTFVQNQLNNSALIASLSSTLQGYAAALSTKLAPI